MYAAHEDKAKVVDAEKADEEEARSAFKFRRVEDAATRYWELDCGGVRGVGGGKVCFIQVF